MANDIKEFDVAIIGGGPAGLTAAIYAQRASLKSCFIEKSAPGGKMVNTAFIENYPGFKNIEGPTLSYEMFTQATNLGAEYIGAEARQIKEEGKHKIVFLADGSIIKAKVVMIGIGMMNRKLDIPGEDKYVGKGVSYCAICDGMFYKNKPIAVVGGGNSAVEEAIYLSTVGSKIYVLVRRDEFRADPKAVQDLKEKSNVEIMFDTSPVEIIGEDKVKAIKVKNNKTNEEKLLTVEAVFPFVGLIPLSILIEGKEVEKSETGFIKVDADMKTTIDGIYAIGDITDKKIRQISTAINDGAIAALAAKEFINKHFR